MAPQNKKPPVAGGDASDKKKPIGVNIGKGKGKVEPLPSEPERTTSQVFRDEAERRARMRKKRFKRRWPEISKVIIKTRPWKPPGPPRRPPPVMIELPELTLRDWVPPYKKRRRRRPKLGRIPYEEMTQPFPEDSNVRKIWHSFVQVEPNKMILQGTIACNSKRYSINTSGAQTACIAVMCRALLEEKDESQLVKPDVDDVIDNGDKYYRNCLKAMKCYKGNPKLQLNQLQPSFFLHDVKYTFKLSDGEQGILARHPDNIHGEADLMVLMEKRSGSKYMMILTIGKTKHFLIWGHPPAPEAGSSAKTICYIFDPHMLSPTGRTHKLYGCGGFMRYPGVTSFVLDFLANHADLDLAKRGLRKPSITLTNIDIVQKEPLIRHPTYALDLKALKLHCQSEWDCMNMNALVEQKKEGKYALASLSGVSLATTKSIPKKKVIDFYQKQPKEPPPSIPVPPDKGPSNPSPEQIMSLRGENFFLSCPKTDSHAYGRDDLVPLPKEEVVYHSPVDIADKNFHSQYHEIDKSKAILRGTRHMASFRYQTFKTFTAIPCCVAALAMLHRHRARAWNEDILDETLDNGWSLYRESMMERKGPIRRLVLGEIIEKFKVRDREFKHKERNIAVWGKLMSANPKVFDLQRGLEHFFKESDSGLLQIPGEFEVGIWYEGGKYYVYHPWPADKDGLRVGLQGGGKACIMYFNSIEKLVEHFLESVGDLKKKPYSISDVQVMEIKKELPEPVNQLKPIAPDRWVIRGSFHEADSRFPEPHRGRQATPASIVALALAHVVNPADWSPADVDDVLVRGDDLYKNTVEHLEKMGISMDYSGRAGEEGDEELEEEGNAGSGTLAAADVLNRFKVSDFDCVETEIMDSKYNGTLYPDPESTLPSLKDVLKTFFRDYSHGVFTARGFSTAIWKHEGHFYFFDPHGCDEYGLPSDEANATAVLVRIKENTNELANVLTTNLPTGADDSFNISPVNVSHSKLNPNIGAPETKLDSKAFEWISKGTAAIMMGPRGENSAIGKAATRAGIRDDDKAGRTLALPAAAAFAAAASSIPPPHMHQDHMFNFLEAGADYYLNHVKKTGNKNILPENLTEKFEMGANTFSIELDESVRLPLRLPDAPPPEGDEEGDEGGGGDEEVGEEEKPEVMRHMKDLLFKMWYDTTKPTTVSLLVGDYHQLGLWMQAGGKVVAFDAAPTLVKGMLTSHRIIKGDELRLQRIKDEMGGEGGGGGGEDDEEEAGGEGEEQPEPEPVPVPPEACPVLIVAASPGELIDKLALQGGLDNKQSLGPYWLYPVKVTNELTSVLKEKKGGAAPKGGEEEEEQAEELIPALEDNEIGKHYTRLNRSKASVRGRVSQVEAYFSEASRDCQDAANSVMAIVVDAIEPLIYWKPELVDGILKYGDRLHTMSVPLAAHPPYLHPRELQKEFHVTNFNVRLDIQPNVVEGDIKAGETGGILNLNRAITRFFSEGHKSGVIWCKGYCVAIITGGSVLMFEPHAVGPGGKTSPAGAATAVLFSTVEEMADVYKSNIQSLGFDRPGDNKFYISAVKVFWEFSKATGPVTAQGSLPDEGYEWKVLTAYVETARGRTILRGSRPTDLTKFTRESQLQSSCGAIVGAAMSHVRRPHLWTRRTVDEVMSVAGSLFTASLGALGYEFRPGEDVLLPLQVLKRFVLGVNYVRFDLQELFSGKLESKEPSNMTARSAIEHFFEAHTHGILWSSPYAVALWRVAGAPTFYMMEPQACGPTGLRIDAQDDGAACVCTFTSAKLLAFAYLQNVPVVERLKHDFQLYAMSIVVQPIKKLGKVDPPLVRQEKAPSGVRLVPATSKVTVEGRKRRASEKDRKHPPGSVTCMDAQRAAENADKEQSKLKGQRNASGWLVLVDGTQFMSACHSIACRKFPFGSRGNQALTCSVMAVAMSRVDDICRWSTGTLDSILVSGDQLYQDSYLHFKPKNKILSIQQVLRKFYTPGNCVCRVVVYSPRHSGAVGPDMVTQMTEFFREEKQGVLVAGKGDFAIALFRNLRGFYMFDPADRDRYGRAVAPPCIGRARACFSLFPNVKSLCDKLVPNIPPVGPEAEEETTDGKVHFDTSEPAQFEIYGMNVSSLRRLNKHER